MSNMANIVTSTLASAKAAASGSSNTTNARGDAYNPQNIIWTVKEWGFVYSVHRMIPKH